MNTSVPHIFANINARTECAVKALATTIARGLTLLDDGYCILKGAAPGAYEVTSPEGAQYQITYDEQRGQFWCACEAHNHIGVCKHLVALMLHKDDIDQISSLATAIHNMQAIVPSCCSRPAAVAFDASDWK